MRISFRSRRLSHSWHGVSRSPPAERSRDRFLHPFVPVGDPLEPRMTHSGHWWLQASAKLAPLFKQRPDLLFLGHCAAHADDLRRSCKRRLLWVQPDGKMHTIEGSSRAERLSRYIARRATGAAARAHSRFRLPCARRAVVPFNCRTPLRDRFSVQMAHHIKSSQRLKSEIRELYQNEKSVPVRRPCACARPVLRSAITREV